MHGQGAGTVACPICAERPVGEMVNECFRHQHPEAYGRSEGPDVTIPRELRYGAEEPILPTPSLPEMPIGNPESPAIE